MAKDVKIPKEQVAPDSRKEPQMDAQSLFNKLIRENNLVVTVSPNTNIKLVSDGSMIIDAPVVNVRYKDGR